MKKMAALGAAAIAQQLGLFHTDGALPVAAARALGQQTIIDLPGYKLRKGERK